MTTLVTGATGFIGGNVARALWQRGDEVRALVRPGANDLAIRDTSVRQLPGDLLDPDSLLRALSGCRFVYHCAANYTFWTPRPSDLYQVNVAGARNLLNAARNAGVRRVVFTSSVSTIGLPPAPAVKGQPLLGDETGQPQPFHLIGHYKKSKWQSELLAQAANDADLPVVIVNPTAPVGPWDVKPTPTGRIPLDFARGRFPAYLNTGMNWVAVDDVAQGHLLAMERGRPGERYILGHRNLSLRAVLELLADLTGRRAPRLRLPVWLALSIAYCDQWLEGSLLRRCPAVPVEAVKIARHPMYVSVRKAVAELGLPQTPIETALEQSLRWFSDYGYLRPPR